MAEGTKKPISPLILGIASAPMLAARRYPARLWTCGGVELRADGLPPEAILPAVADFAAEKARQGFLGPVVFTLRLKRDGGSWEDSRSREREAVWRDLARHADPLCDVADLEIEEAAALAPEILPALRAKKIKVMLSHHAFVPETPAAWDSRLAEMQALHPDAVKFAVALRDRGEAEALLRFARGVAERFPLSCVIGMDEAGRTTRVVSPLLGCPITYAFLGDGPVAPGQLPLDALQACLASAEGRPAVEASEKEWLDWAEDAVRKSGHGG